MHFRSFAIHDYSQVFEEGGEVLIDVYTSKR